MNDRLDSPQPDNSEPDHNGKVPFTTRPLSNRSSKILVILCLIVALAASVGGALFLINIAEQAAEDQENVPADTREAPLPDPGT